MEWMELINAIPTVGFPIVACGALFWLLNKINDTHKQEIDKMTDALNNNTLAITKLYERLGENNNYE